MGKKFTQTDFLRRCTEKHGDRFDYTMSKYTYSNSKVEIRCKKHGISFHQTPTEHWVGKGGCPECTKRSIADSRLSTTEEFIKKASIVHDNRYEYTGVYINQSEPMEMRCTEHNETFFIIPKTHLRGCTNCSKCVALKIKIALNRTREEFIEEVSKIHGNKYEYSNIADLVATQDAIEVSCPVHGKFSIMAMKHLAGQGCRQCGRIRTSDSSRQSTDYFINKSREIHGNKYDYSNSVYISSQTYIEIICPIHGSFFMWPNNHYSGNGCKICARKGYSQVSIRWLNFEARSRGVSIQHAENGGEYKIPGTPWRADGYNSIMGIFEFHGDLYHGNPLKYDPDFVNFRTKLTMGEMYAKTIQRDKKLMELGYNLTIMWEGTWRIVEKAVKKWKRHLKPRPS